MPTYPSFTQQANCLLTDIRDVMSQIYSAENGNRLKRNKFLALLSRKNNILTEANSIINEVNQALNFASSDRSNHLPFEQYLELKTARSIAREVKTLAHSKSPQPSLAPPIPSAPTPNLAPWSYEIDDDEELPF